MVTEYGPFFKLGFVNTKIFTNQVQSGDSSQSCLEWSPDSMRNTVGLRSIWPWFFSSFMGMPNYNHCQPASQMTRNYSQKREQSQCYQVRRYLIHLMLLLLPNEIQKYLLFANNLTDWRDAFKIWHFSWWCCQIFWGTWSEFKINLVRQRDI